MDEVADARARDGTSMRAGVELASVALIALALGSVSLVYPFGRDQGNYAYAAWVWLQGAVPYRDVFVLKPPGTLVIHALSQLFFGANMSAIRWFDLLWQTATAVSVAALARRMFNGASGLYAGSLYPFLYYQHGYWTASQTDAWMNLPIVLALLALSRPTFVTALAAGVCFGAAILLKYTAVLALAPLALWAAARKPTGPSLQRQAVLGFALGGAAIVSLCAAWLSFSGAWAAFIECQTELVPGYVLDSARSSFADALYRALDTMARNPQLLPLLYALIGGVAWSGWQLRRGSERRWHALVVLAWLLVGLGACAVQRKFFHYHFLLLLAPCAISVGWAVASVPRAPRWTAGVVLALLAVWVALTPLGSRFALLGRALNGESLEAQWKRPRAYERRSSSVRDNLRVAQLLARATPTQARVFQWGYDPMINFVAQRRTPSRFLYNYPIAVAWAKPAWRVELLAELASRPPEIFLVSSRDATPHVTGSRLDSRGLLAKFGELQGFLSQRYAAPHTFLRFEIYVLRDLEATIGPKLKAPARK